ncbi:MAG: M23 family metallopeptidase [Actinomycetota bacterium]
MPAAIAASLVVGGAVPASAHSPAASRAPVVVRAPLSTKGLACPVGPGRNVTNSFGDARGGGRRHQGIDIMAAYGTPIYAIESGTIVKAYRNRRGGLSIFLRGSSGVQYFYAHQSANLAVTGQAVKAGQQIGRVGTSGNAAGSAPHLHFEKLVSGRRAVDPYPLVRGVCG